MSHAYFSSSILTFLGQPPESILGMLTAAHKFDLAQNQRSAWTDQIAILQAELSDLQRGSIYFEFMVPRMGKRVDCILIANGAVFVIEFKVGSGTFDQSAIDQVHDYSLDLKNFHEGSHSAPLIPILLATKASTVRSELEFAEDNVAKPLCLGLGSLAELIAEVKVLQFSDVDPVNWAQSGYMPTPTIVEAARSLYECHDVAEIARSDAGAQNLNSTNEHIVKIIDEAKTHNRKVICFVTGVPGAGKTLAGLNIATRRAATHSDEHAVFLSGNGPLVDVLREALARDQADRDQVKKIDAKRKVNSFIQNIHHFRDDYLRDLNPPVEKVVVFDEAQRAWTREQASKFISDQLIHFG